MRIKINDKIYRLKEIESGVDSLMELVKEPQYKDGDFVVNEAGSILIFKKKVGDFICDHAYFNKSLWRVTFADIPTGYPIKRYATEEEKQILLNALAKKGKRWNEEKKCIEDIPVRKFKKGDKVRIKHGVSSKTHDNIDPSFVEDMDDLIGKTMTVDSYTDDNNYVKCEGTEYSFLEEWLEPYVEELKEGDLAIFWDNVSRRYASVRIFERLTVRGYCDIMGVRWDNAIKFESKEQYEKLINGEL